MASFFSILRRASSSPSPWHDTPPVREELFSVERLEQHAGSLALAQRVTFKPPRVLPLARRLEDNAKLLLEAYRASALEVAEGRDIVPAAAWLLDNYHLVEAQIREIRGDLPPGYYRQLPKLADGPFAGYPRVFGMAWAFVAHTDSHLDPDTLRGFIAAYQRVQPLTIGELWAVAITLRIVLVENLRRLAEQIVSEQAARNEADALATRWLVPEGHRSSLDISTLPRSTTPLAEPFVAQLAKRLRGLDPRTNPMVGWLEGQVSAQDGSIDDVIQQAQQRQGTANVTVRNIITSMRFVSSIDWAELFESVSLVDARLGQSGLFTRLDFPTRNSYRSAVEQLARGSAREELEVVDHALAASREAMANAGDPAETARVGDPGYFLIAAGRPSLEQAIGFRPSLYQRLRQAILTGGMSGYVGLVAVATAGLLTVTLAALWWLSAGELHLGWLWLLGLLGLLPATEVATLLVNRLIVFSVGAQPLPSLDLSEGVPPTLHTLIAVPTLLTNEADLHEQIERLEVHHLASGGGAIVYALLTDGVDAQHETIAEDASLLATASAAIAQLNRRYGVNNGSERFFLLHRRRVYNPDENCWMGWERKRGKLHELNRLLRGARDTTFENPAALPGDVRYVITLDADTRLPRGAASRLIGKMAHPLNQPSFDASRQRVTEGYAILQPRVTPSLPLGRQGSIHQRLFSAPGGIDPYAAAISDLYQDLLGEGSFAGKGIYHIDAFEASLSGRVPENSVLSHDLFEGIFARAGLASDIEVIEEFPARYDVAAKRQHRWTRGDWQLLPWIFAQAMPWTGRLKLMDNLRRSLLAPLLLACLAVSWLLPLPAALAGTLFVITVIAAPSLLPLLLSLIPTQAGVNLRHYFHQWLSDLKLALAQTLLWIAFLPDQSWRMLDAIVRTLVRVFFTRRHLLEWTTAAQSTGRPRLTLTGFYRSMAPGTVLALVVSLGAVSLTPPAWPVALLMLLLWSAAPAIAAWISRPGSLAPQYPLPIAEAQELRLIARRTWRYFETFVTARDNWLPPDNFQETPQPVIARRTSPTNMGLYLLSVLAARDFGWLGALNGAERLEATLRVMQTLPRYRGHFFNWYDTQDLRPLDPRYVSSVDSGNLAGHLLVIANACEAWSESEQLSDPRPGIADNLTLVREALQAIPTAHYVDIAPLVACLDEVEANLQGAPLFTAWLPALQKLVDHATAVAHGALRNTEGAWVEELLFWVGALRQSVAEHCRDRKQIARSEPRKRLRARFRQIADTARSMVLEMDFAFLLVPERQLLSIGYSLDDNTLDGNCYDLLASEARLTSLLAIAKGDVPTRHWFRLGRTATPLEHGSALISWSGSMFEYLMPSLVMRAPAGSLLEQSNRLVVKRQVAYAASLGVPWGISESAYNARDRELTYQYSNFGVPGLGLKRGLSADLVVAPYATGLATMTDPLGARRNFTRLADLGALGRYGFYEALDFTRSRVPEDEEVAIVRSFMAHHQGMSIVAIANTLHDGRMRERFHREPIIQASELLLQERIPRDVAIAHPRAEEVKSAPSEALNDSHAIRRIATTAIVEVPVTHLLSNGRYSVMLTATGAGYSRWRHIAISRWQEDATRDHLGSFIFLRDRVMPGVWSASGPMPGQGTQAEKGIHEVLFAEDYARFTHRHGDLTTHLDVLVSGEDDSEVRRVSLTNSGRRARHIDVTSYSELVLTTPATDDAHPAFAKLFVVTEYLEEFSALIATRRRRGPDEAQIWAAHFAVVEGEVLSEPQYETDRARFIGRGRTVATAAALSGEQRLTNTTGTVLDPVFSLRHRLKIAPGKVARVAFWTVVAASREALLDLIDKHHDRSAYERAKTLAWTQAQVQLHHLSVTPEEAADFQRLAAPILYADPRFRASREAIARGAGPQSALWPHAIAGDLPIVLLRIDSTDDLAQVRQLLRAHEYWRMKRLGVDLVIVNERASSYVQDLQQAIETAVNSSQSRPRIHEDHAQGSVIVLRGDLMGLDARLLLQSVARVALLAHRGPIADQLALIPPALRYPPPEPGAEVTGRHGAVPVPSYAEATPALEFFNGLGGFDKQGKEYVTILEAGRSTPAPWLNVIANTGFGFQVSAEGSGYLWADNSRENPLTRWSNDPVMDPSGEAIYVRDEESLAVWTATALPVRDGGRYVARHGFGYSRFEHEAHGIALDLVHFVPLDAPIRISRLTLVNRSGRSRRLSITAYVEWSLGLSRSTSGPFIISRKDEACGAMLVSNPWNMAFPGRVAFADLGGLQTAWTADRGEFLGHGGSHASPAGLAGRTPLSGAVGAGWDPCTALQCIVEMAKGETVEIVSLIGQCHSADEARDLIVHYRQADLDAELAAVTAYWQGQLGAVQVTTPDRAMDIMLNGWLLYQTLACRITARSAFYQASGAYGFRDQLQDGMALTFASPETTRHHLLRAASRQFVEGDVQHWWLPHSGQGVRTRISDDRVWLAYASALYIATSGDDAVLDEPASFLEGAPLGEGEHDAFFQPMIADETASLFEHCARGLDQCLTLTGEHGLPLICGGDWNDGMNRVGEAGKGESVWLGWLLVRTLDLFLPFAEQRSGEAARVNRWRAHAVALRGSLEQHAWDGQWYRRATYDDGSWLGTRESAECRIDSIAQSWAVLSGAASPQRAAHAMRSLERKLICVDPGLALLFWPPFDQPARDPGYIGGYPPGLRENGGQYSHASMWVILAHAQLGDGDKAAELFSLLNPINHARTLEEAERYKVEPYVVAADVYSVAPHAGRGGWTWYTGSAGWMYRAGLEGILGIRREGTFLVVAPCLPAAWPGYKAIVTVAASHYTIQVDQSPTRGLVTSQAHLDGEAIACVAREVRVPLDGARHYLLLSMPSTEFLAARQAHP
ncbi:GH36-type glycosyl hydrolase domain-containing protein [Modicisalibacter xianhensis]|uniref:Cyclic beta-1,2-glucan synthetase n=1 Tax=Modicisalibacter xianhensis TaxID=442341 RepID=A0A1I3D5Z4_9GAMM|nr:glucoamylase family protein [Halomonas xianhensis]SFH82008.1 cyclic beta-1,2-glucan synthetase [Halomonas xianhensis]